MVNKIIFTCLTTLILLSCSQKKNASLPKEKIQGGQELYLLVGTYTSGASDGIYVYRFDTETGAVKYVSEVGGVSNPSYLVVSNDGEMVFSVGENSGDSAFVYSFSFCKKEGILKKLNSQQAKGDAPCFINLDKSNRFAVTANYNGRNISIFPVDSSRALLPLSQSISFYPGSHIHCSVFSLDEKYLFICDLGTDMIYRFNVSLENNFGQFVEKDSFVEYKLERGSGPRHLTFHPSGKFLYSINELSGKVTAFEYLNGNLIPIQYIASDTTSGVGGKGSADIHISPDGRFLYASNRLKADGIAIYKVNEVSGQLTPIGYQTTGIHPRNFIISPNGKYLLVANRDSNNIQIFERDQQSGLLNNTEKEIQLNMPVCLKFISE